MSNCTKCEQPIADSAKFCPHCGTVVNKCSKCAVPLKDNVKFCPHCGASASSGAPGFAVHDVVSERRSEREANSDARRESTSQGSSPAYAGTLFGDLPKSPGSMFSATTFMDDDEDKIEWHERTFVRVLMLMFVLAVVVVAFAYKSFDKAHDEEMIEYSKSFGASSAISNGQSQSIGTSATSTATSPGSIHGKIIIIGSDNPAEGAEVLLMDGTNVKQIASTVSDSDGQYTFHEVPPGWYVVKMRADTPMTGIATYLRRVRVFSGEQTKVQVIEIGLSMIR